MKKLKVTKRPGSRAGLVLKPSRLRMFAIYALLFGLAIGFGLLLRMMFSPGGIGPVNIPVTLLAVLGGALLMAFIEHSRWTLRVGEGEQLEGPTGAFGERTSIPLKGIDWARTRRSLSSRLKIGNSIYASANSRVMVSPWFFDPQKFHEFLTAIGYDKAV